MSFVHLHVHSEYSLLDGACRIGQLVHAAKELGQEAVAITDHGVMYGVIDFYKAAKKEGIKPILGCEVYVAPRMRTDKTHQLDAASNHLVLLCKNETGYQNLMKIVSDAFVTGFYTRPRTDFSVLERYHEGLICLSACLAGEVPQALLRGDYDAAKEVALRYKALFGEDYYIELQDHSLAEQRQILPALVRLAEECGIPLVATNDVHYIDKSDAQAQKVLMAVQMGKTLDDENALFFETEEFYLKSGAQMIELFGQYSGAIENTGRIAQQCNVEIEFGHLHLPVFQLPQGMVAADYLREQVKEGFAHRFPKGEDEAWQRIEFELATIEQMGFVDYFLIVWDFIRYAKEKGIAVGPGRGSAAGSLVSYCLGITDINPLKYNLIFERFLNPERISMPDIDIDFCFERRGEVIDYVADKYGRDHVAQIVTFGTMLARAAIRDTGRALNIPYGEVDTVAKLVPSELGMTLQHALEVSPQLRELRDQSPTVRNLLDMAGRLEGMPRHSSTHAAGVVITKEPLDSYVPLQKSDELLVTQYPMGTLEELGLLKMDFLGLRTLTLLQKASDMIRRHTPDFTLEGTEPDDAAVYALFTKADTEGVFQFESAGMRAMLLGMKPTCFEDIVAAIALYRPGPMDSIPKYIENKSDPSRVTYASPLLRDILDVTYGCIIYQEQVMAIVRKLGGFSLGRADLVRRAMSKKKHDVMAQERKNFIYGVEEDGVVKIDGALRRGVSKEAAEKIFDEMMDFASYAFNKAHAACYAVVAYRTALLKCLHPAEFMTALINSYLTAADRVSFYIYYCRKHGIKILPPDINRSEARFSVENGAVRFGLAAIRNVGEGAMNDVLEERSRGGAFSDFSNFLRRTSDGLNKRLLEGLIKAGCFDCFGVSRKYLTAHFEQEFTAAAAERKRLETGQLSLFDFGGDDGGSMMNTVSEADKADMKTEFELDILLRAEKEVLGVYVSGHPLMEYEAALSALTPCIELAEADGSGAIHDNQTVTAGGIIGSLRTRAVKSGAGLMAYAVLEDMSGSIEIAAFPSIYQKYASLIANDKCVAVRGRFSMREDRDNSILIDEIVPLQKGSKNAGEKRLALNFLSDALHLRNAAVELLHRFPGNTEVLFRDAATGKVLLAPRHCCVNCAEELLFELKRMLGEENVKIVRKK